MKYLVVNADDFGYCEERDEGFERDWFSHPVLSSHPMMVQGYWSAGGGAW
jgi:hypothetical protein